jgi:photosystem II stability/assembly factor-like uncharacterized protein
MRFRKFILFFILPTAAFVSCHKEDVSLIYTVVSLNTSAEIHNLFFIDSITGYAVGGIQNESGFIFKTADAGNTWQEIYQSDTNLNDIYFLTPETGFACGDDILLLKTLDSGNNWTKVTYGWEPPEAYISPLKHFEFVNDTAGYIVGGAYFDRGILFRSQNRGLWWEPYHFDNELSASHFTDNMAGIVGGYGLISKTTDGANSFEPIDISGDFYTSFYFTTKEIGFACGYNGGIYKTVDSGDRWTTVYSPNNAGFNRIHLNDIAFTNDEKGIAVGNDGVILISNDGGNSWEKAQHFTSGKLFSVTVNSDDSAWITSENGNIYLLKL